MATNCLTHITLQKDLSATPFMAEWRWNIESFNFLALIPGAEITRREEEPKSPFCLTTTCLASLPCFTIIPLQRQQLTNRRHFNWGWNFFSSSFFFHETFIHVYTSIDKQYIFQYNNTHSELDSWTFIKYISEFKNCRPLC